MRIIVALSDRVTEYPFPDKAEIQYNRPFHGWITITNENKTSFFNTYFIVAILGNEKV